MAEDNELFSGLSDEQLSRVERVRDAAGEIQKRFQATNKAIREQGNEATRVGQTFSQISKAADLVRDIQDNITNSALNTEKAIKGANKQRGLARQLQVKVDTLLHQAKNSTGEVAENFRLQAINLSEAKDSALEMADALDRIAEDSASLDKSAKFFNSVSKATESIPGLRSLAKPFQDASKAAKSTALNNAKTGKSMSTLAAGGKAFAKSLGAAAKAFLPLLIIQTVVKALKFIVDLFVSAQERTVAIAKQLNISRDAAENIRQDFVEIASSSSNILVNSKSLVEAQGSLVDNLGASVKFSSELLESQVFLTKNLGLSGEAAASFNNMLSATGQSADGVIDNIIGLNNEFALSNGYAVPFSSIMDEISKTSSEVAGYFGFSAENMAKGVLQVRKFGLNLEQATSVAKSLLDFESSIGSELEAELLTGKEFNFERARTLAMTGDVSGATQEVLKQMQSLTKEQRKSPIIMESIAKSTGLSVSEINKAFLTQERLNMQTEQYNELLARGGKIGMENAVEQLALEGASRAEIEKTLTIQESYGAALEKAKDSFTGLVNSGVLNDLSDILIKAVQVLGDLLGTSLSAEQKSQAKALTETGLTERQARKTVKAAEGPGFMDYIGAVSNPMGLSNIMTKKAIAKVAQEQIKTAELKSTKEAVVKEETELATGGIVQKPTRALVGEAGAEAVVPLNQFYAKMDEMIAAIREGGDVFIDGNKAGMALNLGAYRSSTA